MDDHAAGEEGARADVDVAGQGHVVGQDRAVLDHAVVRDVRVGHEEAAAADARRPARLRGAVEGHALADAVAVADAQVRFATGEGHVLRLAAQDRALVHHVVLAEGREALDHGVGSHLGAAADDHAGLHDRVGADRHPVLQAGARVHEGGRVYGHERGVYRRPPRQRRGSACFARC